MDIRGRLEIVPVDELAPGTEILPSFPKDLHYIGNLGRGHEAEKVEII